MIGVVPDTGYRGLISLQDVAVGEVVVSVPLSNVLQVPRSLKGSAAAAEAAQAALQRWQQQHGQLPQALTELVMDPDCHWEAKLVAWLLHLKTASLSSSGSSNGGLWDAYCRDLPAAHEALTFFCYSPQQAEQLQFSNWKALAASQRQLLLEVQQQCSRCFSSSSSTTNTSSNGWAPSERDVAWALSMVKSRTFGRALAPATDSHSPPSPAAAGSQSRELDPAAAAEADGDDEARVVLLMIPFVDMMNHSPGSANCEFGVNWAANSFEVTASRFIPAGQEVTISYGSNKANLALLSCYGFFIPGNLNDAQLLQPVFGSCLAAAGSIAGFQQYLLDEALLLLEQQQQQGPAAQPAAGEDREQSERAARRRCAIAALPVVASGAATAAQHGDAKQIRDQLQLQRYLAELVLYQVQQVLRLCGTTADEDAAALLLQQQRDSMDAAILQLAIAARLDQKLLLLECRAVCEQVLRVIKSRLS